jgi:YD repeat-containing protein
VYGKISKINKTKNGVNTVILYTYDAAGNRITKSYSESGATAVVTYYVRDASGNVMSVYDNDYGQRKALDGSLFQKEIHLYGSSRIGVYNMNVTMHSESRTFITMAGTTGNHAELFTFIRGNKSYELSNHLRQCTGNRKR